jgi:hypothetical protein
MKVCKPMSAHPHCCIRQVSGGAESATHGCVCVAQEADGKTLHPGDVQAWRCGRVAGRPAGIAAHQQGTPLIHEVHQDACHPP